MAYGISIAPLDINPTTGGISGLATGAGLTLHGSGTITGASGAITITASGTNQNITLTPSGSGYTLLNGNVGIGTTGPGLSGYTSPALTLGGSNNGGLELAYNTGTDGVGTIAGDINFYIQSNTAGSTIKRAGIIRGEQEGATANDRGLALGFWTKKNSTGGLAERMRIDNQGNVGIANVSPTSPLTVGAIPTASSTNTSASFGTVSAHTVRIGYQATTLARSELRSTNADETAFTALAIDASTLVLQGRSGGRVLVGGLLTDDTVNILQVKKAGLAAAPSSAVTIINDTLATAVVPVQMSGQLSLQGTAWDTAASQTLRWFTENLPASAATPTSTLKLGHSLNGAAATYTMTLTHLGLFTVGVGSNTTSIDGSNRIISWAGGTLQLGTGSGLASSRINIVHRVSLAFTGIESSGDNVAMSFNPTYNQSGTAANTDFLINRTETALGSGAQLLIDAQVAMVSKFKVTNTGVVTGLSYTSGAPNGGTAAAWKMGVAVVSGTSTLLLDRYVQLDIAGTLYKVALVSNA